MWSEEHPSTQPEEEQMKALSLATLLTVVLLTVLTVIGQYYPETYGVAPPNTGHGPIKGAIASFCHRAGGNLSILGIVFAGISLLAAPFTGPISRSAARIALHTLALSIALISFERMGLEGPFSPEVLFLREIPLAAINSMMAWGVYDYYKLMLGPLFGYHLTHQLILAIAITVAVCNSMRPDPTAVEEEQEDHQGAVIRRTAQA